MVRRVAEQHQAFDPDRRALFGDAVLNLPAIAGSVGRFLDIHYPTSPSHYGADIAVGQIRNKP